MKKITSDRLLTVFILIFGFSLPVQAGDNILIAAASNLRFAMREICQDFQIGGRGGHENNADNSNKSWPLPK